MRTLKQILETEPNADIERAVQAAYWAGQSDMRGEITEAIGKSVSEFAYGRYHNIERKAIASAISSGLINKNAKAFGGHGDSGKAEAEEIKEWEFEI